jgi:hypothetical protein
MSGRRIVAPPPFVIIAKLPAEQLLKRIDYSRTTFSQALTLNVDH